MGDGCFYITTPIYYVNDKPHIGHAYTTILADVLARYHRLLGEDTFFLTGTDEHGQKVQDAAKKNGVEPIEQCNRTVVRFKQLWERLKITNDDFIRTTEERHIKVVQEILQNLYDRGLIYRSEYKGHYCIPCERFFTDKDLDQDFNCPLCKRKTEEISETNYFFKMSLYQQWLIDYIKEHPKFIQPDFRANEVLGFLKKPLSDLCISRPKKRLSWGIELPFNHDYVCYVWFDALVNYISGVGHRQNEAKFKKWWPATYHLMAKDILTTHTVYWPIMLKAIGLDMPKSIFAHGYWLIGGDKMSKSLGNVINPMDLIDIYGVDAFRYYLMADMNLGHDASFTEDSFISKFNSDLANDFGNFVNRVVKFIIRQCNGKIPSPDIELDIDRQFKEQVLNSVDEMIDAIENMRINRGIEAVIAAVRSGNRYIEQNAPWKLAKEGDIKRLGTVLYYTAEALRIISGILYPIMPDKSIEIRKSLSLGEKAVKIDNLRKWGIILPNATISDPGVLFPRIDIKAEKIKKEKVKKSRDSKEASCREEHSLGVISINDFKKIELKSAKIIEAESIPKSEKLIRVVVDIDGERRQLVAGIAKYYKAEDLIGKIVIVVTNLKPAKIFGIESYGMLLAGKKDGRLTLVTLDNTDLGSGASIG